MEKAADENCDDFIEVEDDYQISAIEAYVAKRIKLKDIMTSLGYKRTQTLRKVKNFKAEGAEGLKSKKIGLRNNSLNSEFRSQVVALVKEHYPDFGPVFAAEKLSERQGISIKASTLRRWMIDEGLWQTRFERQPKVYSPRARRECRGELIQVDGSLPPLV